MEDTYETLIQWLEIKVQIMDEAQEHRKKQVTYLEERALNLAIDKTNSGETLQDTVSQANQRSALSNPAMKTIHPRRVKSLRTCPCSKEKELLHVSVVVSVA